MTFYARICFAIILILGLIVIPGLAAAGKIAVLKGYDPRNMTRSNLSPVTLVDREFDLNELQDRRLLAKRGDIHASYEVGVMEQTRGNHRQAALWYRRAALFGHPLAAHNLGVMYYHGLGLDEDDQLAAKWVGKAAENGLAPAQFLLGIFHMLGTGVEEDEQLERQWLEKAALQNHTLAQFHLGLIYIDGHGVNADPVMGVAMLQIAVEGGLHIEGLDAEQYIAFERSRLDQVQLAQVMEYKLRLNQEGYGQVPDRIAREGQDLPRSWDETGEQGGHK